MLLAMLTRRQAVALSLVSGGAYYLWLREQERISALPPLPAEEAEALVARALPLLRVPSAPDLQPELAYDTDGDGKFIGLRCPRTHRLYLYRDRVLDLLSFQPPLTSAQKSLNTPFTAWAYDRLRGAFVGLGMPSFLQEATEIGAQLSLRAGDTVVDLCCGPGNFTVEWAYRVGAGGLVLGLDLSREMLRLAAYNAYRAGVKNVLLIRGDAQKLPFAGGSLSKVNCSGGLHQLPDLPLALSELARVCGRGARLCMSTFATAAEGEKYEGFKELLRRQFALHFVSLKHLGEQLGQLGFLSYEATMAGAWFGYAHCEKA